MWNPFKKKDPAEEAAPPPTINPYAFVVPSYRRGGPYSDQAVPQHGADSLGSAPDSKHASETIRQQQRERPFGTYPSSTAPPDKWIGYKQDNWERSQEYEDVLFGRMGPLEYQRSYSRKLNPYHTPNHVNRPQRTPHDYSFLRDPDVQFLGQRLLTGIHYSRAQTVTDQQALALKGMSVNQHRRSTFRLEPIQYGENTMTVVEQSGYSPANATFTSPTSVSYGPAFRLS